MEKMILPHDMECMKMAMLKHEETFKQQVYELHRLYQTQRMLMKNLHISMQNQETGSSKNRYVCFEYQHDYAFNQPQKQDMEHPASNIYEYHIDGIGSTEIDNECEIELTLGPTSYTRRKNKPTLTRHLNSDSMASFSSSSTTTGLSHKMRDKFDRSLNQPHWLRRILI